MLEEKDLQAIAQMMRDMEDRLDAKMEAKLAPLNDRLDQMHDDLTHVKVRLDYDVDKRLGALNEGVDAILETMVSKSRVEALEDDVALLKTAFMAMSKRIAELEKAQ